jgi:hypothetical protein
MNKKKAIKNNVLVSSGLLRNVVTSVTRISPLAKHIPNAIMLNREIGICQKGMNWPNLIQ